MVTTPIIAAATHKRHWSTHHCLQTLCSDDQDRRLNLSLKGVEVSYSDCCQLHSLKNLFLIDFGESGLGVNLGFFSYLKRIQLIRHYGADCMVISLLLFSFYLKIDFDFSYRICFRFYLLIVILICVLGYSDSMIEHQVRACVTVKIYGVFVCLNVCART
ncbi:hypothetical protein HanIR_Chr12g0590031 [Helianthus annuus]|nr:hypothetical protein HanIR_Chr12g0590031 [Helianthus annuus]